MGAGSPLEEETKEVDWKKEEEEGGTGAGSPLEEEVKEVDWKRRMRRRRTQELGQLWRRRRRRTTANNQFRNPIKKQ